MWDNNKSDLKIGFGGVDLPGSELSSVTRYKEKGDGPAGSITGP